MQWTDADREALISFKQSIDSDDIKIKEQIKKVLLNNRFIIHVLDNKELESADSEPDEYFGINILPFYMMPDIQHSVNNYLCYEVNYTELDRYNHSTKLLQIVFHVLCRQEHIIDEETGISKHDLIAALIQNDFNYSNYFGSKIRLVSDVATTTDTNYAVRTLTFEQRTDNNLVKSNEDFTPRLANKDVSTLKTGRINNWQK